MSYKPTSRPEKYDFSSFFKNSKEDYTQCIIVKRKYANTNNTALLLLDNFFSEALTLSVNLDFILPEKIVLLKDYSENKGIVKLLVDKNIVRLTGIKYPSGFIDLIEAEILDMEKYKEIEL